MGDKIIKLISPEGVTLMADTQQGAFGSILQKTTHQVFAKQSGRNSCGIQSCGIILNALHVQQNCLSKPIIESLPYTEAKMYQNPLTSTVISHDIVEGQKKGCNLDEVNQILTAHGCQVLQYNITPQLEIEKFRTILSSALKNQNSGVIGNYFMRELDPTYPDYGHHSPVAGYHVGTDRFLVLDVWSETPECWVKTADLFKAMDTVDTETGRTRGFVVATKD